MLFDEDDNIIDPAGVCAEYETGSPFATFSIIKPAVDNTRVDMSPYGQSIFANAIDAIQAVDIAFDAIFNEISISKMRIFLSDVMFSKETTGSGKKVTIPFGKNDCTVFRKIMPTDDMIQEIAPALRGGFQAALRGVWGFWCGRRRRFGGPWATRETCRRRASRGARPPRGRPGAGARGLRPISMR